jgi:hypothetical protein
VSEILLTDEFNSTYGEFVNYDTYETVARAAIHNQRHRDLYSFLNAPSLVGRTMYVLSQSQIDNLNGMTMENLETLAVTVEPVVWNLGTVAPRAANSNIPSLSYSFTTGTWEIIGIQWADEASTTLLANDIKTGFAEDDHFVLSMPSFPATVVNQSLSSISLTSDPDGDFLPATTVTVSLVNSETPMVNGNSEFRALLSTLDNGLVDLTKITSLRIRLVTTGSGTFQVNAIRTLDKDWTFTGLDMDTMYGVARKVPARNGRSTPVDLVQPTLWKSNTPPGEDDPRPIDAEMSVLFNTGSMTYANSFTLYFRELTEDFLTQLDLDTTSQAELNGRVQPDVGTARYDSRFQSDLQGTFMGSLEDQSMIGLERTPDYESRSWIQFVCQWGPDGSMVTIVNTEYTGTSGTNGYSFPILPNLLPNTTYAFYSTLEENSVQATIYLVDAGGNIIQKVFDSTRVTDDSAYKRRAGRFGWLMSLGDGTAWVDSIRQRSLMYGEYRSRPFYSNTPVVGAELFVETTPKIEHFDAFGPGPNNLANTATISRDPSKTSTGDPSWKVQDYGLKTLQGLQSNSFLLTDFAESGITFDLLYPSSALLAGGGLRAFLIDESGLRNVELLLPLAQPDQWQRVRLGFPFGQEVLTGRYRFALMQPSTITSTWWIDNISIFTRSVSWRGRAVVDDPWDSNDARWTPFYDAINMDGGGVLFPRRGREMQISGRALRHTATINSINAKPHYAELGRRKGGSAVAPALATVSPSFSVSNLGGRVRRFTGSATSTGTDGTFGANDMANYEWNFGDGAYGIGSVVTHEFPVSAVYTITLVATDPRGRKGVFTNTVAV